MYLRCFTPVPLLSKPPKKPSKKVTKKESHVDFSQYWGWFSAKLNKWYHPDHRQLPWKNIDDAYYVWVSEVFLQQTQADRVVDFFIRFTAQFPHVQDLSQATFEEALPYFKGLGFYGRLRRMILTAKAVVDYHDGVFPRDIETLKTLPGIGEYTARAVASFAYKQNCIAPDTNVARVISRFWKPQKNSSLEKKWVLRKLNQVDKQLLTHPFENKVSINQVLMDFGSSVCKAKSPLCHRCPLVKRCTYGQNPSQYEQVTTKKKKLFIPKNYNKVAIGVLIHDNKILVSRRKPDQTYPGLLEFPGGKVEKGESTRSALQREFLEEVGVDISVRPAFEMVLLHPLRLALSFHRCRILKGEVKALEGQELFWMTQKDLNPKEFLPASMSVVKKVKKSRL